MSTRLLLTGATGFIGSSLLQKWLDFSDASISVLVRPKRGEPPRQRVLQLLSELYPTRDTSSLAQRVTVVEGDLSQDRFGLQSADYDRLAMEISHIVHCGAAVRFDLPLAEARTTNCGGAQNILDLAARCRNLQRLDYIGTAYVAGKRRGLIKEIELDEGQEHNNSYEKSKLEAEKLIRHSMAKLPATIFRPTIVIGNSETGRVSPVSAFCRVLKMYELGILRALPGDPSAAMDLVSLDYTADAVFSLSQNPKSIGRCFHVSAGKDNATTLAEIADLASSCYGKERFVILSPEEFDRWVTAAESRLSVEERGMIAEIGLYMPYLTGNWRFDNSNTLEALTGTGLSVPKVSSYFRKIVDYIAE